MRPKIFLCALVLAPMLIPVQPARALGGTPLWAQAAVTYLKHHNAVGAGFTGSHSVPRRTFTKVMKQTFGGGYSKTTGKLRAAEVSKALVQALGQKSAAVHLSKVRAGGWDPDITMGEAYQVVAKEMGLRHDSTAETEDAGGNEPILGAEMAWAVWQAKTGANSWGADALKDFSLPKLRARQKKVVRFAFDQFDEPYVWAGEWESATPAGYPYGAQAQGGFDCSGFTWYVLRHDASSWHPKGRKYSGWSLADRSSSGMGGSARPKVSFGHLRPGDAMFFASGGRKAGAGAIYHVGVFLGRGWMIDSSGSQGGVSLSEVGAGSWYRDEFAWGRHVIH